MAHLASDSGGGGSKSPANKRRSERTSSDGTLERKKGAAGAANTVWDTTSSQPQQPSSPTEETALSDEMCGKCRSKRAQRRVAMRSGLTMNVCLGCSSDYDRVPEVSSDAAAAKPKCEHCIENEQEGKIMFDDGRPSLRVCCACYRTLSANPDAPRPSRSLAVPQSSTSKASDSSAAQRASSPQGSGLSPQSGGMSPLSHRRHLLRRVDREAKIDASKVSTIAARRSASNGAAAASPHQAKTVPPQKPERQRDASPRNDAAGGALCAACLFCECSKLTRSNSRSRGAQAVRLLPPRGGCGQSRLRRRPTKHAHVLRVHQDAERGGRATERGRRSAAV